MAPKRVTLDQLAVMVANGLESVQEEMREGFRQVGARLDAVETKLGGHDTTLDSHSRILDSHSRILESHSRILESHSRILNRIERKLDSVTDLVDDHSIRLQRLEDLDRRS